MGIEAINMVYDICENCKQSTTEQLGIIKLYINCPNYHVFCSIGCLKKWLNYK